MLTLFASPKPFRDRHTEIIQRNAVTSWTLLKPRPEILLLGDEPSTVQLCKELNLRHIPGVACNEFGTPLLNDLFKKAEAAASFSLVTYLNADLILMNDFMDAVQRLGQHKGPFLAFGQRWDVDMDQVFDFSASDWEKYLREYVICSKPKGPLWGLSDYFIFSKGLYPEIPPFALGRTAFDNWLIYGARVQGVAVIDITPMVMAVHQKHGYLHQPHRPRGWEEVLKGVEARRNRALSGGEQYNQFGLYDATHRLTRRGLKKSFGLKYFRRSFESVAVLKPRLFFLRWLNSLNEVLMRGRAKAIGFLK